jgi:hypothetical protein
VFLKKFGGHIHIWDLDESSTTCIQKKITAWFQWNLCGIHRGHTKPYYQDRQTATIWFCPTGMTSISSSVHSWPFWLIPLWLDSGWEALVLTFESTRL